MNCSCHICEPKDASEDEKEDKKKGGDAIQGASSGEVTRVWVGTGAKVAPQQVLRKVEGVAEVERAAAVETGKPKEAVARAKCWKGSLLWGLQGTETVILPSVTFLVVAIYSVIAVHFY